MAKKAKKKTEKPKGTHGGKREGSGKPSKFPGKMTEAKAILLTQRAHEIVEKTRKKLNLSRSDFHEALTRLYGASLTIEDVKGVMG